MKSATQFCIVFVTTNQRSNALLLARGLVSKKLAACVNILGPVRSIYRFKEKICDDREFLLMIKTKTCNLRSLESWVSKHHPYEVPEIISVALSKASDLYLAWMKKSIVSAKERNRI